MQAIMSTAFFLIPGARLSAACAADFLASASSEERAALNALGAQRMPAQTQCLASRLERFAPHHAWAWKVLARRGGAARTAPALWRRADGPHFSEPLIRLAPLARAADGSWFETALADEETMPMLSVFGRFAFERDLRLQIAGASFFFSDKHAHDFESASLAHPKSLVPFVRALDAPSFQALLDAGMEGPDAAWAKDLAASASERLSADGALQQLNERRAAAGRPVISAFWLTTPGRPEGYHPPSLFRAVLSDDPVLQGWALAAGIPAWRVGTLTERGDASPHWPQELPPGDVIALLDDLYEPWLAGDLPAWRRALPALARKLAALRAQLPARNIDSDALVLFGIAGAATLMQKPQGILDRFRRPAPLAPESWLIDPYEHYPACANAPADAAEPQP